MYKKKGAELDPSSWKKKRPSVPLFLKYLPLWLCDDERVLSLAERKKQRCSSVWHIYITQVPMYMLGGSFYSRLPSKRGCHPRPGTQSSSRLSSSNNPQLQGVSAKVLGQSHHITSVVFLSITISELSHPAIYFWLYQDNYPTVLSPHTHPTQKDKLKCFCLFFWKTSAGETLTKRGGPYERSYKKDTSNVSCKHEHAASSVLRLSFPRYETTRLNFEG